MAAQVFAGNRRFSEENVSNFSTRSSRAGKGSANILGAWDFISFCRKQKTVSTKFSVLGGYLVKPEKILTFCVQRLPGGVGVGVFHSKGWWSKSSCPPSKVCFPWVSKEVTWDVPGILLGCPGHLGVFKKFVQQKTFVPIFRSLCLDIKFPGPFLAGNCAEKPVLRVPI